jgi:hypothetical protein
LIPLCRATEHPAQVVLEPLFLMRTDARLSIAFPLSFRTSVSFAAGRWRGLIDRKGNFSLRLDPFWLYEHD